MSSINPLRHALFKPLSRFLLFVCVVAGTCPAQTYSYIRTGHANRAPAPARYNFGIAMMGGGDDLDEAFRWLCVKSGGGDVLVLRAAGNDEYNAYINGLCHINSVATLIIPDRAAAQDAQVAKIIRSADAIFIAGGDQARYVKFWKDTAVQDAINSNISAGKPIAGTSAGLAVLGEFIYGALRDRDDDKDLTSAEALPDPYADRVTLARGLLKVPLLHGVLTDSHFAKRNRMGRSLVFLARIVADGWSAQPREIAIDEKSAVLVEPDGEAKIVGSGKGAYFLSVAQAPEVCAPGKPLTIRSVANYHAPSGTKFNLSQWSGTGGENYTLSVIEGKVVSSRKKLY